MPKAISAPSDHVLLEVERAFDGVVGVKEGGIKKFLEKDR
jgi:hypothetical protein